MSALTRFFEGPAYQRPDSLENSWQIVLWWEKRRFHFNAVLAAVGAITCTLMIICAAISEPILGDAIGLPGSPLFGVLGIIMYAMMANICFTGGWIAELLLSTWKARQETTDFGLRAFRAGMKFSIGLTLCPALFCWAVFLLALLSGRRLTPNP